MRVKQHHPAVVAVDDASVRMAHTQERPCAASDTEALVQENRRLAAALRRATRRQAELELLYALEQDMARFQERDALLSTALRRICTGLSARASSLLLCTERPHLLLTCVNCHPERGQVSESELDPGQGIAGWAAATGEMAVVECPEQDPRFDARLAQRLGYPKTCAILAVPLPGEGSPQGALEVLRLRSARGQATTFTRADVLTAKGFADQLARAMGSVAARQKHVADERLAAIGHMLAGVAHDLRDPLAVISGYAELVNIAVDDTERRDYCDRILCQVGKMNAMVVDLLAFARHQKTLNPVTVALAALAPEIREELQRQCKPLGIELHVLADGASLRVDLGRTRRIVSNLARNAIEVLQSGKRLDIQLLQRHNALRILVADNGPGIPEEVRRQMFEPFVTSGKGRGMGLGLSIVKRFVEDHHGSIHVETQEGKGTCFEVVLPAVDTPAREES